VAAGQELLEIGPLLARPEDHLHSVLRRSAAQPETRLIGVVDDAGVLVGVLPILRLVESVVAQVVPEAVLGDLTHLADIARFGHAVDARTVKDAMMPPAMIAPEATVIDAIQLMHRHRVSGLYVVDREGRPTGYLDMLELAMQLLALRPDGEMGASSGVSASPPPGKP
jgi:CBS domain-containing protein